ncbi:hypothetical protein Tco_0489756 [Tanacetum coccineum]
MGSVLDIIIRKERELEDLPREVLLRSQREVHAVFGTPHRPGLHTNRDHPLKHMENRGIFVDSGCSGHNDLLKVLSRTNHTLEDSQCPSLMSYPSEIPIHLFRLEALQEDHLKHNAEHLMTLEDEAGVEALQEDCCRFKLQQVWVLVDLPMVLRYSYGYKAPLAQDEGGFTDVEFYIYLASHDRMSYESQKLVDANFLEEGLMHGRDKKEDNRWLLQQSKLRILVQVLLGVGKDVGRLNLEHEKGHAGLSIANWMLIGCQPQPSAAPTTFQHPVLWGSQAPHGSKDFNSRKPPKSTATPYHLAQVNTVVHLYDQVNIGSTPSALVNTCSKEEGAEKRKFWHRRKLQAKEEKFTSGLQEKMMT